MEKQATSSLPSSSSKRSLSSEPHLEIKEGIETHEEIQRGVPEFGGKATSGQERTQNSAEEENKRQESRIVLNAPEGDSQSFNCCDGLRPNVGSIDKIYENFTSFPVAGAIILDETHERCLLVKGCKGPSWSFPCGKKCKDEEDHACAIRKVLEEIGCDISYQLNKKEYLELTKDDQRVRLYIVAGVSEDRPFEPLTKGEISEITWYPLDHLGGLELFMMAPFIPHLKKWIVNNPSPLARRPDQSLKELCVWSAKLGGKRTTTVESYTRELDIKFGSLTFDQFRAVAKGRLVMKSNNTKKPEVETTTSGSSSRKPEVGTTTSYKDNITFGSLNASNNVSLGT